MTTAQRPARALVDRRRHEGLSLSGSPSGLAGIATPLHPSATHDPAPISTSVALRMSDNRRAARRGMPSRPMNGTVLFEQLMAGHAADKRMGTWGKCIHSTWRRLHRCCCDWLDFASIPLSSACPASAGALAGRRTVARSKRPLFLPDRTQLCGPARAETARSR